ncbi:hypothetical protein [Helicobacter pylori]|nr:hypothetical protein [Helicobacter pylori]
MIENKQQACLNFFNDWNDLSFQLGVLGHSPNKLNPLPTCRF